MSENEISQNFFEDFFKKYRKTALVFLRGSKTREEDFDPFRNTGFVQQNQNPLPVKVLTKTVSPNSLIIREIGLTESGAIQIILHERDVELIKNSEKVTIKDREYYAYNDAVGNKLQIFPTDYSKYSRIILFTKQV